MARRIVMLFVVVALVGACSGDDDDAGTAAGDGPVDVCALLSDDDVRTVLGGSAETMVYEEPPACDWETDDLNSVLITVRTYASADAAEAVYRTVVADEDYDPVDGVGDRAYSTVFELVAQKGPYELTVEVFGEGDDEADAIELAKRAIARLP